MHSTAVAAAAHSTAAGHAGAGGAAAHTAADHTDHTAAAVHTVVAHTVVHNAVHIVVVVDDADDGAACWEDADAPHMGLAHHRPVEHPNYTEHHTQQGTQEKEGDTYVREQAVCDVCVCAAAGS